MVTPSSCLERGVTYTLRMDFDRYRSDRVTPEANILIDSVCIQHLLLIPRLHEEAYMKHTVFTRIQYTPLSSQL